MSAGVSSIVPEAGEGGGMNIRDIIARAIYEEPGCDKPWDKLDDKRRTGWLADAERVMDALANLPEFPDSGVVPGDRQTILQPEGRPAYANPFPALIEYSTEDHHVGLLLSS